MTELSHRSTGDRRRTVQKAADWLAPHAAEPAARRALEALEAAERGASAPDASWRDLAKAGPEGRVLGQLLDERGL